MKSKISYFFLFFFLSICSITCKKDKPEPSHKCPQGQHWDEAQQKCINDSITTIDTLGSSINSNVIVVDSAKWILNTDSNLISKGTYEYSYTASAPDIKVNDVIIGATNGGYIRRVSSITQQAGKISLETTQGSMSDVFKQAQFNVGVSSNDLSRIGMPSKQKDWLTQQTNNFTANLGTISIYKNGPLSIDLTNANVELDGDWNFGFSFKGSSVDTFEMSCKNAVFNAQCQWNVKASQAITLAETESTIKTVTSYFTTWVPVGAVLVPVVAQMKVDFVCQFSASIDAQVETDLTTNTSNSVNIGLEYKNAQWQTIYDKNSTSSVSVNAPNGKVNSTVHLALIPKISFLFYGVAGPYSSIGLKELISANVASPSLDWDFYAGAWLQTILGAKAQIFGKTLADYNQEWNTDTFHYQTPDNMKKISGDNQTGSSGEYLSQPIKVQVVDNNGSSQSNVPVYFKVTAGSGSVENNSVVTDQDGFAGTRWKLGSENIIQTVTASAKKANETLITNAPIEFASTTTQQIATLTTTSVSTITQASAVSGGNITNDGGSSITARGICWSTAHDPTIANSKTSDGTGTGSFISNINGLDSNATYYVRAYATNGAGTAYGNEISFSTAASGNLISNGDFFLGNTGFTTNYTYCSSSDCLYTLSNNGYSVANDASSRHRLFIGKDHTDGKGQFMIVNGAISNYVVWSETVDVSENTDYNFTSWLCSLYSQNTAELVIKINGIQVGNSMLAPSAVSQWVEFTRTWNSGSNKKAIIEIFDTHSISTGNDFGLDDISFQ